jgi:hypothetical protein
MVCQVGHRPRAVGAAEQVVCGRVEAAGGASHDPVDPQGWAETAAWQVGGVVGAQPGDQLGDQPAMIRQPWQRPGHGTAEGDLPQPHATDQHPPVDTGVAAPSGSAAGRRAIRTHPRPRATGPQTPAPVCARREPAMRRAAATPAVRKRRRGAARCGRLPRRPALPQRQPRRPPTPTAVAGASHRTQPHRLMALRNPATIVSGSARSIK